MSTSKSFDKIAAAVLALGLLLTILFINGEKLGVEKVVDEDAEAYEATAYFTANDLNGDWDASKATATITLNGDSAKISGNGAYFYDGDVVITGAGYYVFSGSLTDGGIVVDAYDSSKVFILLSGVELYCSDDACLRVDQADKVFLTLAEGTTNRMESGGTYSDAALADNTGGTVFAHDDLTINGGGSLDVVANCKHGVDANDDLKITGGTITVTAPEDGLHVNDSFRFANAELTIAAGDDAIHSDADIYIESGTLLITECYEGLEALRIEVAGGDIMIYPSDDGFNANGGSGGMMGGFGGGGMMGGDGNMGGFGGRGGRGGQSDSGDSTGSTDSTDTAASTGGTEPPQPPDGETPDMSGMDGGDRPALPDGASDAGDRPEPPDGDFSGERPEPPEGFDGEMPDFGDFDGDLPETPDGEAPDMGETPDVSGGQTDAGGGSSTDGSDEETYIRITGGNIMIVNENARDADGLDSNGSIYIEGGTILVSLNGDGSNNAIDYGSENGGVAEISGGTIIACGGASMAESFDSTSTQPSIAYTTSAAAGTVVTLKDAGGSVLLSWAAPCSFTHLTISCPDMTLGETYTLAIGESEEEITLESMVTTLGESGGMGGMMGGGSGGAHGRGNFSGGRQGFTAGKSSEKNG